MGDRVWTWPSEAKCLEAVWEPWRASIPHTQMVIMKHIDYGYARGIRRPFMGRPLADLTLGEFSALPYQGSPLGRLAQGL